ncbi:NrfD/PsrC family molybdoenzyme membrane anchor subunit [Pseudonocardia acidicola]|uniref:Polysulfide reductase NrfD n=1 Tax=Pseudonocardia acidicola TaxID=2724939 RepID=A0ABX1S5S0_9PSEU|nr:NrfD/PsrC family molybdoenzyme membrane anchor subunit [Pseudonocardia acidicola]NMH96925.1 polysulfide reductase NrfD [Pseudonocardia acidicola]
MTRPSTREQQPGRDLQAGGAPPRRRRRGRGERLMVEEATFRSYYGRPIIKPPVWKVPDVPAYLYLGGMAGVTAALAALADATGRPQLRRVGRLAAATGATISVGALVHDLGRPERFLHMMRVIKPTSPLSVGSWILAPFGTVAGATAVSELTGIAPGLAHVSGAAAGVLGPAMTTYTAVLLADTAVPAWHEAHKELPFVFAGSAMASGGGVGLLSGRDAAPARRVAVAGAALELAATAVMERRIGLAARAYRTGRAGAVLRAAQAATVAGAAGAALSGRIRGRRGRLLSWASAALLNAGAAATRYGVFEAGMASARDPEYTVVPQRRRLAERERQAAQRNGHPTP